DQAESFVGYYQLEPGSLFMVRRVGPLVFAQLNFQEDTRLLPQDAATFIADPPRRYQFCPSLGVVEGRLPAFPWFCKPDRAVVLRFVPDDQGHAKELVFYQDGATRRAPRVEYAEIREAAIAMGHHIKSDRPSAGSSAALRKLLESMQAGAPDYDLLTPGMAAVLRAQYPEASAKMKPWGAVKGFSFQFVDKTGADFYQVE